ncbi:MAG TPA: hypothetical protein VN032_03065 [Thermoanaerobaculia bacterium]|jgi:hypothetical protein|nr:hypothetical protein [Thermoanaerobaculia bacterium]
MDQDTLEHHLTDAEFFALAAPATGEPEALPRHLSRCRACSHTLQDWKGAVRSLADEETGEIDRRTPEEWRAAEEATMAAIRRSGRPRRSAHPLRWAVGIAAALVVLALALPARHTPSSLAVAPTPAAESAAAELTPADRADDELLRQAFYLAEGGDVETDARVAGRL